MTFVDSHAYKVFKSDLNHWWLQNHSIHSDDFLTVKNWVRDGLVLGIECDMRLHHGTIYTTSKKAIHRVQRIDPTNRLKALLDTLSKLIGIDDSIFFATSIQKVEISDDRRECFYLQIGPIEAGKDQR